MSVATVNERLAALTAAGTAVWLDQIRRGMIESGELERMVNDEFLRGVTSNPAIFEKSILGSADYDEDLKRLADEGKSAREIYRAIALQDVRAAADVLRPVYDATVGMDGYVSWEVAPRLAHDTEGTLEQARMYWELVDRPNLMIKIPATEAGLPAIEQALFDGMNINVTLLFKVGQYERVMEAFVRAACDVLRPVYDATNAVDGYVSWEVAPRLAHDTEGTLEQARLYWGLVSRPSFSSCLSTSESTRETKKLATEWTSRPLPSSWRRSIPRMKASVTRVYFSTLNSSVTLMFRPS